MSPTSTKPPNDLRPQSRALPLVGPMPFIANHRAPLWLLLVLTGTSRSTIIIHSAILTGITENWTSGPFYL